jgi:hypothetical protein
MCKLYDTGNLREGCARLFLPGIDIAVYQRRVQQRRVLHERMHHGRDPVRIGYQLPALRRREQRLP